MLLREGVWNVIYFMCQILLLKYFIGRDVIRGGGEQAPLIFKKVLGYIAGDKKTYVFLFLAGRP